MVGPVNKELLNGVVGAKDGVMSFCGLAEGVKLRASVGAFVGILVRVLVGDFVGVFWSAYAGTKVAVIVTSLALFKKKKVHRVDRAHESSSAKNAL